MDSCVIVGARYVSKTGLIDRETLFSALHTVVSNEGALRTQIVGDSTKRPFFRSMPSVALNQVVTFVEDGRGWANVAQAMEAEFLAGFQVDSDTPLWRLTVFQDGTILFAWHHAIGDGLSGLAFHRQLLKALNSGNSGSVTDVVTFAEPARLTPSAEDLTDMSPSWSKLFKEIFSLFVPTSWKRDASAWTGWNNCPTSPSLVNLVRLVEISAADVTKFTDICRARQTTLTAAFHGLGVSVVSQLIAGHPSASGMTTLSTQCPISLRSATNISNDTFADHVTTFHTYPSINPSFSWEYASEYASQLRAGALACREEVGMLKYLFGDY
jgi:hypothetical protein